MNKLRRHESVIKTNMQLNLVATSTTAVSLCASCADFSAIGNGSISAKNCKNFIYATSWLGNQ